MKNFNWKQNILTAVITIAVTVAGGMALYYLQFSEAKLEYSFEKILPFEGQEENLNIYHIKIFNSGNKVSEEVICHININPAAIKNYQVSSETPITYTDKINDDKIVLNIKTLNPDEFAKISILGSSTNSFPDEPNIKLRAKGVNGKLASIKNSEDKKEPKTFSIILGLIAGIASILSLTIKRLFGREYSEEGHTGEQNEIIAYLCGLHGIENEVDRYLSLPRKTSYWSEMDRLTSIGINSNNEDLAKSIKQVITDLLKYARMAKSSKGIGYYNLGRIDKYLGKDKESEESLNKSKKLIPNLLKKRVELDPIFKN